LSKTALYIHPWHPVTEKAGLEVIRRRLEYQGTHLDREHFGNYHVRRAGEIIGKIGDFPRGQTVRLIREALEIMARCEHEASTL
jgi:hypothetical protein